MIDAAEIDNVVLSPEAIFDLTRRNRKKDFNLKKNNWVTMFSLWLLGLVSVGVVVAFLWFLICISTDKRVPELKSFMSYVASVVFGGLLGPLVLSLIKVENN